MARNGFVVLLIVALAAGNVWFWVQSREADVSEVGEAEWPDMRTRSIEDLKEPIVPQGYLAKSYKYEYYYKEQIIDPPIEVGARDKGFGTAEPEQTMASTIGSWYAADYAAWLKNWTEADRKRFARRAANGRGAEFFESVWRKFMPGTRAYIVARADVQDMETERTQFVILAYVVRRKGSDADLYEKVPDANPGDDGRRNGTLVLVKTEDGWRLTNRYSDHPVYLMWWSPTQVIKYAGKYEPKERKN